MEWISVDDRLPEEEMIPARVIVGRSESAGIPSAMESSFIQGQFMVHSPYNNTWEAFLCPTHWQPLPEPPK